ncbi:Transcriptional regulatory protein LiaR [Frondihabitans sp. 762G35]|uniref:response regulator transcription factor n=1 Tax=Frondihabitans sp. 762G35 TaxID=1446794 RepID=UPI000D2153E2|nr:response regulator transcription factor [Frondihabitans sp. 762G35]ARC58256.1 Transcriptional regulatory protein LiaR [Frondihabitans sp. 762G35]
MSDQTPLPVLRVALVEDHEIVAVGFAQLLREFADIQVVAVTPTVRDLDLDATPVDLVVLDLRLGDGSSATDNIGTLVAAGADVLILTAAEDPQAIRAAAKAGALGIVRKSQPVEELVDAIRDAARGTTVAGLDWAAAIDGDEALADAGLSAREREILALYASGEKAQSVAYLTNLSKATVANYVSRIRAKYANAGRPAHTKVDLHRRAAEDGLLTDDRRLG